MKEPITDTREIKKVYCNEDEQETIITISKTEPDIVSIWSCDNDWIKIFKDLMKNNPNSWKCFSGSKNKQGRYSGYFFECKKEALEFKNTEKKPRKSQ